MGRGKFYFALIDDYNRKSWVILLKKKAETSKRLKEWKGL